MLRKLYEEILDLFSDEESPSEEYIRREIEETGRVRAEAQKAVIRINQTLKPVATANSQTTTERTASTLTSNTLAQ